MFDSYGLPLSSYKDPTLQAWFNQWDELRCSEQTLPALDSFSCGHYALFFLKARVRGVSFQDFLAQWHPTNLVLNERQVAEELQCLIKQEVTEQTQTNVNRSCFFQ